MIGDLRTLALALGGEVVGSQVIAPGPGHSRKDRSLSINLHPSAPDGFLTFSHSGDNFAQCRDHVKRALGLPAGRSATLPQKPSHASQPVPIDERIKRYIDDLLAGIRPILGTPGEAYLRDARRIDTHSIADVLARTDAIGWNPSVKFNEAGHELHGQRLGCFIARMTEALTAKPTGGISRTYVHQGRKISKAKGLGPAGIVRLTPVEEVLGGLFIAEGLETALAAMSIGLRPMWSTGSAAVMTRFPVVAGIESLTILADHDENGAGERAARETARRWRDAGRDVRARKPKTIGDYNDILMGRRANG